MDIAAMSIGLHAGKLHQAAGLAVVRKAMDMTEIQIQGLAQMMQSAAPSNHQLDVRA